MNKKKIILIIALVAISAFAFGARDGVCPITGERLWGTEQCETKGDMSKECESCEADKKPDVKSGGCCLKK
jgi:hypothetical protein